jgi:hypothetical protein
MPNSNANLLSDSISFEPRGVSSLILGGLVDLDMCDYMYTTLTLLWTALWDVWTIH